MIELLNIRFSFFLRSDRKNELAEHTVVFRITYRNTRRDLFTGLYCSPASWDRNNGLMTGLSKSAIAFNKNLDLIVQKANEVFQELRYAGPDFTMDELVNKIKGKDAVTSLLVEHIEESTWLKN